MEPKYQKSTYNNNLSPMPLQMTKNDSINSFSMPFNMAPPISKICSTRKYFQHKPLIGLQDIGATDYMNVTLQCLCNIEKLVDYFKYNKHFNEIIKNDPNNEKLCTSFKILIENLYPNEEKKEKVPMLQEISRTKFQK